VKSYITIGVNITKNTFYQLLENIDDKAEWFGRPGLILHAGEWKEDSNKSGYTITITDEEAGYVITTVENGNTYHFYYSDASMLEIYIVDVKCTDGTI
jgi:hypothetical protein